MTRDTENTTYRGYPIQVQTDRIIVTGPNRTRAEFHSMARARHFIRTLIALEEPGVTGGAEPAARVHAPVAPGSSSALTEPEMPKRPEARPASLGVEPSVMGGSVSCSVSATTTEPGVTPDASRGPTANGKPAGPSEVVALNYLRGMT